MTDADCRTNKTCSLGWVLGLVSGITLLPCTALAQPAEPPAADAADQPAEPPADAPAADTPAADAPTPDAEADTAAPDAPEAAAATDSSVIVEGGSLFEDGGASTIDTGDAGAVSASAALPFELNGYVRGDAFFGKETRGNDAILRAGYGELALQLRTQGHEYGDAFAEARFRYGQQGDTQDLIVDLREAYANLYAGPFDLRLGKQIIVWGKADGFNPTNNITPVDLTVRSPLEDDRRVGNFGARAFLNFAPVRIEGVWMPLYIPTKFPPIPLEPGVTLLDPVLPGPELKNGLGAGRVHLELSSFEMSASYLYGNALLPGLERYAYTVGPGNASVTVQRRVYTHQVIGFDFSTAFGEELGLRGEAAYRAPINEEAIYTPNREVNYVVGLDRTFGSLSVIAQYIGKYVLDWEREGTDDPAGIADLEIDPDDLNPARIEEIESGIDEEMRRRNQILFQQTEELQHTASVRLEYLAFHDTLSLSVLGAYNFSTAEWLAFPKITYKFSDALSGSIGGELYNGPEDTLLDYLDQDLTAGYVELKYAF